VRIVYTTGAARAWLTPEPPPGSAPVRISMSVLRDHLGEVLDRARDGEVFEVADTRGIQPGNVSAPGRVHGYLAWEPPEALKRQPGVLQFYVKSRAGRLLLREFASATATEARRA
jgi:hypothetical protein